MKVILSVIIPCYNNGIYLKELLECCLRQTYKDWELIIVDDQSTDGYTHEVLHQYSLIDNRIKFFIRDRQPKGSVVCRNIGFEKAVGKYIIHFDADDLISDTCFENRVRFMEENQDCDYASFPTGTFYDGSPLPKWNGKARYGMAKGPNDLLSYFISSNYPFSVWCNIYKKESIESLPWDENVKIYTDFSFIVPCILAGLKHKFCSLGDYDYYYRIFRKGKINMCSDFISDEKCKSTCYLFDKTLSSLEKSEDANRYKKLFKHFIVLHLYRLLQEKNAQKVEDYISVLEPYYDKNYIKKLRRFSSHYINVYKGAGLLYLQIKMGVMFSEKRLMFYAFYDTYRKFRSVIK